MEDNQIMGNDIEKCNAQPVFKRTDGVYADKYPPEKGWKWRWFNNIVVKLLAFRMLGFIFLNALCWGMRNKNKPEDIPNIKFTDAAFNFVVNVRLILKGYFCGASY